MPRSARIVCHFMLHVLCCILDVEKFSHLNAISRTDSLPSAFVPARFACDLECETPSRSLYQTHEDHSSCRNPSRHVLSMCTCIRFRISLPTNWPSSSPVCSWHEREDT